MPKTADRLDPDCWGQSNAALLDQFVRATDDGTQTATGQASLIQAALRRDAHARGRELPLRALLTDPTPLAEVLGRDQSLRGVQVSRDAMVLTQRAFAAFTVGVPPPAGWARDDLRAVVAEAWERNTEVRGLRRYTAVGATDSTPPYVPTADEIAAVIDTLRSDARPFAALVAELVHLAYTTGSRLGALLGLRRCDLTVMRDGRVVLALREKSNAEHRLVQLPGGIRHPLWPSWADLPADGLLFAVDGDPLTKRVARSRLDLGCARAGVTRFVFHSLRRAFATDLAPVLSLEQIGHAGGWRSERVAESYVRRRPS